LGGNLDAAAQLELVTIAPHNEMFHSAQRRARR
jgi:hypothetical protein